LCTLSLFYIPVFVVDQKYKEAAQVYATCRKYNISIVNNTDYIKVLDKYAESELVKKVNLYEGEEVTHYYSVGD